MRKKVLVYLMSTPAPQFGGVSKMACTIGALLEKNGYHIHYVAFQNLESRLPKVIEGVNYFPSRDYNGDGNAEFLKNLITTNKIEIVINHIPLNERFADLLYKVCGNKAISIFSVVHNASLNIFSGLAYRMEYRLRKHKLGFLFNLLKTRTVRKIIEHIYIAKHREHFRKMESNSKRVILVSESNIADFNKVLGFESKKVMVIPNCVEINKNNNLVVNYTDIKEKIVVWCGRIETYRKRVDLMLDIWAKICMKFPVWTLYILGGGEVEEMKEYANKVNARNVIFTGPTNPQEYYRKASIFCHTSVSESFGLVIIEAMSHGVVPIAFDIWPAAKDVIPNDCGYLIPNVDRELFVEKLSLLMTDEQQRINFAKSSFKYSVNFGVEQLENRWIELLNANNRY